MSKLFFICLLTLLTISCVQEEIESYDDLTKEEQRAIRARASARCLDETKNDFIDYKKESNSDMLALDRGYGWPITYKSGSTTTTSYMYVWKNTPTATYFLYKQLIEGTTSYSFIKLTTTINSQMIDDLRIKKCEKTLTVSSSSSALSVKFTDIASTDNDVDYKTTEIYSTRNSQPVYLISLDKNIAKKTLNNDGNVTSTATYDYSVGSLIDYRDDLVQTSYLHANYSSNRRYCVADHIVAVPNTFGFPFSLVCSGNDAINVNTSGDAAYDFTPNVELINP